MDDCTEDELQQHEQTVSEYEDADPNILVQYLDRKEMGPKKVKSQILFAPCDITAWIPKESIIYHPVEMDPHINEGDKIDYYKLLMPVDFFEKFDEEQEMEPYYGLEESNISSTVESVERDLEQKKSFYTAVSSQESAAALAQAIVLDSLYYQ